MHPLLEELRLAELEAAVHRLPHPPSRVLELGAGSGWQSLLLGSRGYEVVAVDVSPPPAGAVFDILPIDGVSLPFATGSFDVVFSSNVLEHVVDLPALLAEADRVLCRTGRSVHLIPTPTWRVLTMATFYLSLPMRSAAWLRARRAKSDERVQVVESEHRQSGARSKLMAVLWEPPHGEFSSAAAEVWAYRATAWRRRLGGNLLADSPAGVLYTGYGLLPWLPIRARQVAARLFGSTCRIYVVEPRQPKGGGS